MLRRRGKGLPSNSCGGDVGFSVYLFMCSTFYYIILYYISMSYFEFDEGGSEGVGE